jgi:hypothetical protein
MLKQDKSQRFEFALHVAHTALSAVAEGYLDSGGRKFSAVLHLCGGAEAVAEALATLRAREITGCASAAEKPLRASPEGELSHWRVTRHTGTCTAVELTPEVTGPFADPRQLAIPGA